MLRTWSVVDFALIWLGGLFGAATFVTLGSLAGEGDWLVVVGLAGQYVGNVGVLWLLWRRKERPDLGLDIESRDLGYVGLGLLLQTVIALLFLPLARLLFPDGQPPQQVADLISDPDASVFLKLSLFSAAVLAAPITEEVVFRGVLLKSVIHRGRRFAILVTALVFAGVHMLGLDTERFWASAALVLPPVFLLGLVLAFLTTRSGRLGPAIFLHSGWNLLAALVLLIPTELLETVG